MSEGGRQGGGGSGTHGPREVEIQNRGAARGVHGDKDRKYSGNEVGAGDFR